MVEHRGPGQLGLSRCNAPLAGTGHRSDPALAVDRCAGSGIPVGRAAGGNKVVRVWRSRRLVIDLGSAAFGSKADGCGLSLAMRQVADAGSDQLRGCGVLVGVGHVLAHVVGHMTLVLSRFGAAPLIT